MLGENGDGNNGDDGKNGDGSHGGEGGEVISLEEARRRAQGQADAKSETSATVPIDASNFLQPIVSAIAVELSKVADADGNVKLGGEDEASKQKTAAVLRGIGAGLGAVLGDAFAKWAEKMVQSGNVKIESTTPSPTTTPSPPSTTDDPDKKN
jgi:hypothetical protein